MNIDSYINTSLLILAMNKNFKSNTLIDLRKKAKTLESERTIENRKNKL